MSRGQGLNKRRAFLLSLQREMHPCCMRRLINRKGQRWGVRVRGVERQKAVSQEKERKEMKWPTKRPNVRMCDDSQKTLIWRGGSRMCEESQETNDLLEAAMSEVLLCVWQNWLPLTSPLSRRPQTLVKSHPKWSWKEELALACMQSRVQSTLSPDYGMHQRIHICPFICALNMCGSARAGVPESDSRWTRDQQRKAQLLFIAQSTVSITRSAIAFKATCSTTASILYISIQESNPATWTSHKAPNDKESSPNRLWRRKKKSTTFPKGQCYLLKEHEWSPLISIGTKQKTNVSRLCRCCFVKACLFPEFEKKKHECLFYCAVLFQ